MTENIISTQSETKNLISENPERRLAIQKVLEDFKFDYEDVNGEPSEISFSDSEIAKILQAGTLFGYTPETFAGILSQRFRNNIENLGVNPEDWKKVVIQHQPLIYETPDFIKGNLVALVDILGISMDQVIEAGIKQPTLLSMTPETVAKNIAEICEQLHIVEADFVKSALKHPSLLTANPQTIFSNIDGTSRKLNISAEQFVKAALKQPPLFYMSPETINSNAEEIAKILNVDKDQFVAAGLKAPFLFYRSPITLSGNFDVLELIYGSKDSAWQALQSTPNFLAYSKERDLMHYFYGLILGKDRDFMNKNSLIKNPEELIRKYYREKGESQKAEEVIDAIKEIYKGYTNREKSEAVALKKAREDLKKVDTELELGVEND